MHAHASRETNSDRNTFQFIPERRRAYTGISGQKWATIFGPPSVLKELRASPRLLNADIVTTAASGAVHASHLWLPDRNSIMGSSTLLTTSTSYLLLPRRTRTRGPIGPTYMVCWNIKYCLIFWQILSTYLSYSKAPPRAFPRE